MLAMSTLMMPAPGMTATAMSAPGLLPVPSKLEVAGKLTINPTAASTANKAGTFNTELILVRLSTNSNVYYYVQHVAPLIHLCLCYAMLPISLLRRIHHRSSISKIAFVFVLLVSLYTLLCSVLFCSALRVKGGSEGQ